MNVLEVTNLSLSFGKLNVLLLPKLNVKSGEISGIIGESGSGKSLFLLAIMGLLPKAIKTDGAINLNTGRFQGNLLNISPQKRRELMTKSMGIVFQEPMSALNPRMKCGEQILEIFKTHTHLENAVAVAEVHRVMQESGLEDTGRIYQSFPHQISGGQRQRVMIAMATALNPDLVLADEPTTALDPETGTQVLETLVQRCRILGSALILVSHDLDSVSTFSDNITVLRQGSMVAQGTKNEVLNKNGHPYVLELLDATQRKPRLPLSSKNAVFTISDLTKSYGKRNLVHPVFKGLNMALVKGETITILGKSGSGKSTLAKILTGLEKADSGEVVLNSNSLLGQKNTGIQMVFQDPYSSLNAEMRCGEIVAEVARVKVKMTNEGANLRAIQLLNDVGLNETYISKYPHQLSGGQRQRLCIARALASEPEVLILDEAVAALDPIVQKQVLDLLQKIQEETGIIYLFITHDHKIADLFAHQTLKLV